MRNKESKLEGSNVTQHNCIKQCFERKECSSGRENLREATTEEIHFIKKAQYEEFQVLISSGLNSWKEVIL